MNKTKDQQAREYAEKKLKNKYPGHEITGAGDFESRPTFNAYDIEQAFEDGYTACEQSMWRSVEEEMPEEMERVLVWTGDEALVCWFTSMRRFRTTLSCQERYIEDKSLGIKQHLSPCRADVTEIVTHWQRITPPSLPATNTEKKP